MDNFDSFVVSVGVHGVLLGLETVVLDIKTRSEPTKISAYLFEGRKDFTKKKTRSDSQSCNCYSNRTRL